MSNREKTKKLSAGTLAIILLSAAAVVLTVLLVLQSAGVFYKSPTVTYPEVFSPEALSDAVYDDGDYQYVLLKDGGAMLVSCGISDHSVTEITVPSEVGGYSVKAIGDSVFKLMTWITRVTVPEGVTYIGNGAFYGCCYLDVVFFPSTLTDIQNGAFEDCDYLSGIYYSGSRADFEKIAVGKDNLAITKAAKFYS